MKSYITHLPAEVRIYNIDNPSPIGRSTMNCRNCLMVARIAKIEFALKLNWMPSNAVSNSSILSSVCCGYWQIYWFGHSTQIAPACNGKFLFCLCNSEEDGLEPATTHTASKRLNFGNHLQSNESQPVGALWIGPRMFKELNIRIAFSHWHFQCPTLIQRHDLILIYSASKAFFIPLQLSLTVVCKQFATSLPLQSCSWCFFPIALL